MTKPDRNQEVERLVDFVNYILRTESVEFARGDYLWDGEEEVWGMRSHEFADDELRACAERFLATPTTNEAAGTTDD
jgi:hypothetical protein